MKPGYDAIIVGGGHNGLTCGAYLARAGVRVLVVERREIIGGAAVTGEIAPGYRSSMASYYQGLLQPKVILDLELQKYGFEVLTAAPTVFALEGGRTFTMWDDPDRFAAEIAKFSNIDGEAYAKYRAHMLKIAPHMKQLLWEVPVNPSSGKLRDLKRLAGFVWRFRKIGPQFYDIYNLLTMSAYDYLSRWFSSDDVKLVLGFFAGGGGANSSLKTPGSAYMLARGIVRDGTTAAGPGGFMKGGMGAISDAIRRSGEAHGMEVRTSCPVEKILTEQGRAVGVRMEGGEEIRSKIVIANATARTIFTKLVDTATLPEEFNRDIRNIRCESTVFRVNLALSALPEAPVFSQASPDGGVVPQMTIAPNVAYMERAWHQAQGGDMSDEPFLIVKLPSMVDPTLAPAGHHIMNIFGGHAPYTLARGNWDTRRDELWEKVLRVLKTQFPSIEDKILHRQILTPLDMERIFDLPNGHVHHGEISADQMFFRRHSPQFADYRSPVEFLYQASASVHPGGGVTGVPGHNAAKVILEDRRKWS
ncbi:NAD(P)/FAD-dependent oxidoreductase [Pseudomonas sp. GX19020]|jgi:phytoene dehydrogenase-like protein|uniref:phytoene desaturase family protein n=1 Tax=Pseudomonas sp. GX19020 TaxID=2942277 RepID=UPI002019DD0D|nr:NAD(P)/FAD-dependent oxidoreductase [Pseudomonas sp. GX19020]MCL4068895.1 NAD(P)/FAD-dependent oxidoreductase [Pseudomonas sp. GX19020]